MYPPPHMTCILLLMICLIFSHLGLPRLLAPTPLGWRVRAATSSMGRRLSLAPLGHQLSPESPPVCHHGCCPPASLCPERRGGGGGGGGLGLGGTCVAGRLVCPLGRVSCQGIFLSIYEEEDTCVLSRYLSLYPSSPFSNHTVHLNP